MFFLLPKKKLKLCRFLITWGNSLGPKTLGFGVNVEPALGIFISFHHFQILPLERQHVSEDRAHQSKDKGMSCIPAVHWLCQLGL